MIKVNQHTVPKCYLKNFASDNIHLYVYNKMYGKLEGKKTINSRPTEKYFHDFIGDSDLFNGIEQPIENFFDKEIENKCSIVLQRIIANLDSDDICNTNDSDKYELAKFIVYQHIRTTYFRKMWVRYYKNLKDIDKTESDLFYDKHKDFIDLYLNDREAYLHAKIILNSEHLTNSIYSILKKCWIFYEITDSQFIYTSDNPVICRLIGTGCSLDKTTGLSLDISNKNTETIFPLSSKYLLLIIDYSGYFEHCKNKIKNSLYTEYFRGNNSRKIRNMSKNMANKQSNKMLNDLKNKSFKKKLFIDDEELDNYNSMQFLYSDKYVFTCNNNTDSIYRYINTLPNLNNINLDLIDLTALS